MNSQMRRYIREGPLSAGTSVPVELLGGGTLPSQHVDVFTDPEALWTSQLRDLLMAASSCRRDQLLTQSPVSLLSPEDGVCR